MHTSGTAGGFPLSGSQEGWWFLHKLKPQALAALQHAVKLSGTLEMEALGRALYDLVARHAPLRTTYRDEGGIAAQTVPPALPPVLARVDLSAEPVDELPHALAKALATEAARPFDLEQGPPCRFTLVRLSPGEHVLTLTAHQICLDTASLELAHRELGALYDAARNGQPPTLPPLPISYGAQVQAQRKRDEGLAFQGQLDFWKAKLSSAPTALDLPQDLPPPPSRALRTERLRFTVPADLTRGVEAFARGASVELGDVLLAAFEALLCRYARQEDFILGLFGTGRTRPEVLGLLGAFATVLPVRVDASGEPSFLALLERSRRAAREALLNQDVPAESAVPRAPELKGRPSLIQVTFEWFSPLPPRAFGNLAAERVHIQRDSAWTDLSLALEPRADGTLAGTLSFAAELFKAGSVERLATHYQVLLAGAVRQPKTPVSRLPLLDADERRRVLKGWNATRTEVPRGVCVHHLFEAQVARTPDAVAVVFGDQSLTYAELNARADGLARELVSRGLGPEARVALVIGPALEGPVALYGVLKAGAAYVPLDPDAPSERLAFALKDCGARLVLAPSGVAARLPDVGLEVFKLDPGWRPASTGPAPRPAVTPQHLAYAIYTSGSTGEPKGILVSHAALVNHNLAVARRFGLGPGDRMLQFLPLCFDAAGEEIYPPLLSGSAILIRSELVPIGEFLGLIQRERLTVLSLPPAYLHEWLSELERQGLMLPTCLRLVLLGGEKLLPETWALWLRRGGATIPWINVYGPTEATITSALCEITASGTGLDSPVLPIGGPIANGELYLLDGGMEPVPVGHPGELYIGGAGLARGYLGRPDQTAERFVPHPFSLEAGKEGGARLYRTGDVARHLPDGRIEFLGRIDHQVKLRGFRVELGEIEAVLRQRAGVQEAVVVVRGQAPNPQRLVAYVVPGALPAPSARALRDVVAEHLPVYMVPSTFVMLDALPLTSNGKVDRKALPEPPADVGATDTVKGTSTEETLRDVWHQVLGGPRPGLEDNFFDLGGHSLSALQVLARVGEALGVHLELRHLFEAPTLKALALHLDTLTAAAPQGPSVDVAQLSDAEVDALLKEMLARKN